MIEFEKAPMLWEIYKTHYRINNRRFRNHNIGNTNKLIKFKISSIFNITMEEFTCGFGFEIEGLKEAKTDAEKITAIEKHVVLLGELCNEAISSLERKVSNLKYPDLHEKI